MSRFEATGSDPTEVVAGPDSYPVNLRLRDRRVLVVGAGRIAAAKIGRLRPTGARITVVAPTAIVAITTDPALTWHRRPYQRGEVASYRLAITCTGNPEVDAQVHRDGEAAGVWVNSADDIDNCSFFLPAVARVGSVTVAVGTGGASPALASFLRRRAQADLDDGVAELAALLVEIRAELQLANGTSEHPAWIPTLDRGGQHDASLLDVVRDAGTEPAGAILREALGLASGQSEIGTVPNGDRDREVIA